MYVRPNFKTKKQLKDAVESGVDVSVFSPGPFPPPLNGETAVEGPHYPQPHTWYARVQVSGGKVIRILR